MSSLMQETPVDLSDFELEEKCEGRGCDRPATWFGWSAHGWHVCPATAYCCDSCKVQVEQQWVEILKRISVCARCRVPVHGQLSDNLRFMRL